MTSTGMRLYVHLPPHLDAAAYRSGWESGTEPDASPYGFHLARELGWSVRYSRPRPAARWPWRRVAGHVNRLTWGIDVRHAWRNRRAMRQADVVWSMLEQEALAVAALMRLRIVPRKPVVTGTVWMLNEWAGFGRVQRSVIRNLSGCWSVLTAHAARCLEIARRELPGTDSRLLHFGVSATGFPIIPPRTRESDRLVIFAMGNDRTRDWGLLLRAFGNDDRFRVDILCSWFAPEEAAAYDNVRVIPVADLDEIRSMYDAADYAAVPMRENLFSGITVALEAAALGVPILATRTGGLATYFQEDEMLLAAVDDDAGLREAVIAQSSEDRRAMAERAQARFQAGDYTTRGMIGRYDAITREVREAAMTSGR